MATHKTRPGCIKSCISGLAVIFIYPLLIIAVIALFTGVYMAAGLRQIRVPPALPEFSGPTQQHHWSLQEKRLELEDDQPLVLSREEFDAFLTAYSVKPSLGYCLHRVRFVPDEESGTFYLLGSGFFMRNMVLKAQAQKTDLGIKLNNIVVNSWPVPDTGFINDLVKSWLYDFFKKDYPELIDDYASDRWKFDFDANSIRLEGSILER